MPLQKYKYGANDQSAFKEDVLEVKYSLFQSKEKLSMFGYRSSLENSL